MVVPFPMVAELYNKRW